MKISVAREGLPYIFLALTAAGVLVCFKSAYAILPLSLAGFLAFFFRDPLRIPSVDEAAIIAPADGRVVRIDEMADHGYLGSRVRRISIFLSVLDVHINYAPVTGMVDYIHYRKGSFKNAMKDISSHVNENNTIGIKSGERMMAIRQIAGMIARRIVCRCMVGDSIRAGEKIGMIKFGSRVDVFLPIEVKLLVERGQKVRGGETVIARLE